MSDKTKFDAGKAAADLITSAVNHDQVANKVWAAMEAAISATRTDVFGAPAAQLLRGMKETHGSMRAVIATAEGVEKRHGPTGRWADALLLARAQYDALFIGLLLAHDERTWGPRYRKAGWAAMAIRHYFSARRFRATPAGRDIRRKNVPRLKLIARREGITAREWSATTAEVRGGGLHRGATSKDAIRPLPTPGQIVARRLLKNGPYEALAPLIWQQWRLLCDPTHIGMFTLQLRNVIRAEGATAVPAPEREQFIYDQIISRSIPSSLVAVLTLVTAVTIHHRDDAELLVRVVTAWELLEKGTIEGGIIWDGWARQAVGALG